MDGSSARLETQHTFADGVREGRLPLSAVERADFGVAPSLAVRIWLIVGPFHIAADAPHLSGAFADSLRCRQHGTVGRGRRLSIRASRFRNRTRGTATSAIWKMV